MICFILVYLNYLFDLISLNCFVGIYLLLLNSISICFFSGFDFFYLVIIDELTL
jgi:hypothetical protein